MITFKKIIYINKNWDEGGMIPKSIIVYLSKPWTYHWLFTQDECKFAFTESGKTVVNTYKKLLIIDLWFVEFNFKWETKKLYD